MIGIAPPAALVSGIGAALSAIGTVDAAVAKVLGLPAPHISHPILDLYRKVADLLNMTPPKTKADIMAFDDSVAKVLGMPPPKTQAEVDAFTAEAAKLLNVNLNAIPNKLDTDEQAARANAASWNDATRPGLVASLVGVSAFSTTFDADYTQLQNLCTKIMAGDVQALPEFNALLKKWRVQTTGAADKATTGFSSVQALQTQLDASARALGGDHTNAAASAAAAQAAIPALKQQIDAVQKKIAIENLVVSSSLLGMIAEQLIIKLTGQLSLFSGQLDDAERALSDGQASAEAAAQISTIAAAYATSTSAVSTALQSVGNGWTALNANFSNLIEAEGISDINSFTLAELDAAKADWDNLATQAKLLASG